MPAFRYRILPRGLLARAGLLLLIPFMGLQLVLILAFWFGHWQPHTDRLTKAVVNELALLIDGYETQTLSGEPADGDERTELFVNLNALSDLGIRAASIPGQVDLVLDRQRVTSTLDRQLRRRLAALYPTRAFTVDSSFGGTQVLVTISQETAGLMPRHYRFLVDRGRLFSDAGLNFLLFILISGVIFLLPSYQFLRGQVRPIRNLAREAAAYGRGVAADQETRAQGAIEVRQAIQAFRDMRARITLAVDQRTNMLSGVSHDLRTPLTRLKLQLALMDPGPEREGLEGDVLEMEAMLEGYLDYAKGTAPEEDHLIILADLVQQAAEPSKWPDLKVNLKPLSPIALKGRKTALTRLVSNLLSNAQRHANNVWLEVHGTARSATLIVSDDGPGIEPADFERVLQPFQRLDEGRNLDAAGVGLGLSVCVDIARSHGGALTLGHSTHGGLEVKVKLPA
ncbi:MAG: ATP-binding protein [Alphaproteobacteria bacterium]